MLLYIFYQHIFKYKRLKPAFHVPQVNYAVVVSYPECHMPQYAAKIPTAFLHKLSDRYRRLSLGTPQGCTAIQRDLDRLEKCADRNLKVQQMKMYHSAPEEE